MGYTKDDFLSKQVSYLECVHEDDAKQVIKEVEACNQSQKNYIAHEPYRIFTKDGLIKWVLDYTVIIRKDDGTLDHYLGYVIDVTAQMQSKQKLQESELRWKFAVEGSGDGMWDRNLLTHEIYISDIWKAMLGYSPGEIHGTLEEIENLIHPLDRQNVIDALQAHLENKSPFYQSEHRMMCKNGSYKWVLDRGIVVQRSTQGRAIRIIGTLTDISKQKQALIDIQQQKQEFEAIFYTSKDGIAIFDLESHFLDTNTAYEEMLGFTKSELKSKSCLDLSTPEDYERSKNAMQQVINLGYITNFEKSCYTKDGRVITVDMSMTLMPDKKRIVASVRDITESTKLKNELVKQKEFAQRANHAKSEFLANMSHEIRTPLNGILGFVDILRENIKDAQNLQYLNIIHNSSQHLLGVISDILDLSKIESGKLEVELASFNPKEELMGSINLFSAKASEKNIYLDYTLSDSLPEHIISDALRIKQTLSNLLSNAIKFTAQGKKIFVHIDYVDKQLTISVKDEGIGIAKEKLGRIFEAFSQENVSVARKYGGTGLGLSICKRLVELLGGTIKVESTLNEGSIFTFSIPVQSAQKLSTQSAPEINTTLKGHILLTEDNSANQMYMSVILKKFGLSFDIASDGLQAIEMFQKAHYDLVLMDENMPNMNGIEATKQILAYEQKTNQPHTPIIALTANALKGDREKFLGAGMDEYLTKPVEKKKLLVCLNKFLQKEGENMGIDLQSIADELDFDLEDVQMLLSVFLESSTEELANMQVALQNGDLDTLYKSAHAIKGSAANLLLNDIAQIAKEIELNAKESNDYEYKAALDQLSHLISQLQH
jgi:PAS domain S-box-containing protein